MKPRTGEEIVCMALGNWGHFDDTYDRFHDLLADAVGDEYAAFRRAMLTAIETWTADQRLSMLTEHWSEYGGLQNVPAAETNRFYPSAETMVRLNVVVQSYKVPRTFLHLYVHAHLFHELGRPNPVASLDGLVEYLLS